MSYTLTRSVIPPFLCYLKLLASSIPLASSQLSLILLLLIVLSRDSIFEHLHFYISLLSSMPESSLPISSMIESSLVLVKEIWGKLLTEIRVLSLQLSFVLSVDLARPSVYNRVNDSPR